jgi:hypothetical protein
MYIMVPDGGLKASKEPQALCSKMKGVTQLLQCLPRVKHDIGTPYGHYASMV